MRARAAPLGWARRRCTSTTGTARRMAGMRNARSVPSRSSSSTLLSGTSPGPKPASISRFCAVRLSIGTISAPLGPSVARRSARSCA